MTRHMRLDVAGAISNGIGWKWVTDSENRSVTKRQAIAWLRERLAEGKHYLPIGDCPTFDYEAGECPGHEGPVRSILAPSDIDAARERRDLAGAMTIDRAPPESGPGTAVDVSIDGPQTKPPR